MTALRCRDGKTENALVKSVSLKNAKPDTISPVSLAMTAKNEQSARKIPTTHAVPSIPNAVLTKSAHWENARTHAVLARWYAAVHASIPTRAQNSAAQMHHAAALSPVRNSRSVLAESVSCHRARMKRNHSALEMTRTSVSISMPATPITAAHAVLFVRIEKPPKQVAARKANAPIHVMTAW